MFDENKERRMVDLQLGLPCMLTYNVSKSSGLVNGARCTIRGMHERTLEIELHDGPRVLRRSYGAGKPYFNLVRCYACTLAKLQGSTLDHITIMTDVVGVPAAGYVAISRVRSLQHLLFLIYPRRGFFTPGGGLL